MSSVLQVPAKVGVLGGGLRCEGHQDGRGGGHDLALAALRVGREVGVDGHDVLERGALDEEALGADPADRAGRRLGGGVMWALMRRP